MSGSNFWAIACLGLAIAELLAERFPDAYEGELARWYNHLVRAETCADVALGWDLGPFIVMSGGEAVSGGRGKKTILANTCEAVLGAIFADAGYEAARDVVYRFWSPHLGELEEAAPDPKSVLQEWAQGKASRFAALPRSRPRGPRSRADLHRRGTDRRRRTDARARRQQARGRAGGGARHAAARGGLAGGAEWVRPRTGTAKSATRCGFVALIGAPNSGKSTLTNALVGAKVSIVTHKAQTTRGPVRGIALIGKSQLILVDTPGIFQPKRRLDRAMSAAAWERAGDADLVALVIDAERGLDKSLDPVLDHFAELKRPVVAVLNKIDKVSKPDAARARRRSRAPAELRPRLYALGADRRRRRRP